jgi:hypothetical protein
MIESVFFILIKEIGTEGIANALGYYIPEGLMRHVTPHRDQHEQSHPPHHQIEE